ncbi:RdgB/HAM1 family non-canonical purine NTP pyrophosphatase [Chlorobium sp. N1]|uniref:RdgB/HAM1 family non-canonical purine NTP pyrophosphatase n=1 Tax=Chlorobium sp. N1 TaxID=2491138 RepID=UPI00103CA194|nr:RdgB/HAM1 family non-canonical purine NTP pyrophosphatase [Chlorobium sp. N1]TCD47616.1 RdgB/HAM1 family non-canonical purine NTP pyrophosphatase [Chlorobium sp. N1]
MHPSAPITTIVLATANPDKVRELSPLLERISPRFRVTTLMDEGIRTEIEETEETLEGNALLKARAIFEMLSERFPSMIALADDTGLEVDPLGGRPGVYSARFAPTADGRKPTYEENVLHLLRELEGVEARSARFRTVIALRGTLPCHEGGRVFEHCEEGRVEGAITTAPEGTGGFGYDPVFRADATGRTFASMNAEEKNAISHRGLALRRTLSWLHTITKP